MTPHWQELLQVCVTRFGMSAGEFWQLSVPEIEALFQGGSQRSGFELPDRKSLSDLMADYPDRAINAENEPMETFS